MKFLHYLAFPLLAFTASPAFAKEDPASSSAAVALSAQEGEPGASEAKTTFEPEFADALELNWNDFPTLKLSPEEARLAGYPCFGPDSTEREDAKSAVQATARTAQVQALMHRFATAEPDKQKRDHVPLIGHGKDNCADCDACEEGKCVDTTHRRVADKDFDCVDCPDYHSV